MLRRLDAIYRAVEAVDRQVARLVAHASVEEAARMVDFHASWGRLVDLLELGSPAEGSAESTAGAEPPADGGEPQRADGSDAPAVATARS